MASYVVEDVRTGAQETGAAHPDGYLLLTEWCAAATALALVRFQRDRAYLREESRLAAEEAADVRRAQPDGGPR
jgi:hypothetical protein